MKQISSLDKIRCVGAAPQRGIQRRTALAGERVSYQLHIRSDTLLVLRAKVESALVDLVKLYYVRDAQMDSPVGRDVQQNDYITFEPSLMPDILVPMEATDFQMTSNSRGHTVWVKVDISKDAKPGIYHIKAWYPLL